MRTEDYLQSPVQEEGTFRGTPVAWTVERADSGAVAIALRFSIKQKWHGKETGWSQPWPSGYWTEARAWIIKKDGELNSESVENLRKCGIWNGEWDALAGDPPQATVHLEVGSETYGGKLRYRANWINPDADEPTSRRGFAPADPTLLQELKARFGPQTKAIGSSPTRHGPPPAPPRPGGPVSHQQRPPPPQKPDMQAPAAPPPPAVDDGSGGDESPNMRKPGF